MILATLAISCESRTYEEISDNRQITETVKYTADVKPIMDANCLSCHGATTFKPYTNYAQVKANIDIILERIQRPTGDPQKMPQGSSLSQTQINTILKWKADGLQEN